MPATLSEQLVELDRALAAAAVPHAFGGAIALAYCTLEPRGTRDLDVNIFVDQERCAAALAALPSGVDVPDAAPETITRDGQMRLWWDDTPVDVFFDNLPVHAQAARHVRRVPFAGTEIPVLGPTELVVFKAMFDRTKDWADIEAVIEAEAVDLEQVRETLADLVDETDQRFARIDEAERRARR
ncbi:MAG: hypothetical protein AAGC46_19640 [Solirubrobacteraceae bacterium]|nr:hypothetical protein [Patulibacter sp.]